jgi:hypothetical protein
MLQMAWAVTIGPLPSLAAGRVLAQILYRVNPSDPFALVASGTMLASAAFAGLFFPSAPAPRMLNQALRTE